LARVEKGQGTGVVAVAVWRGVWGRAEDVGKERFGFCGGMGEEGASGCTTEGGRVSWEIRTSLGVEIHLGCSLSDVFGWHFLRI